MSVILSFASLSGCLLDEEEDPPAREVRWGLKIQIGQYVKDSIFPPTRGELADSTSYDGIAYKVSVDSICYYEPGCDTVPRYVQLYGWDSTCFSGLRMTSLGIASENLPLDSNGVAVWSGTGLFTHLPGGVTYSFYPLLVDSKKCYVDFDYPSVIDVHFNDFTTDSWGEHGL